jgi:hypothetical protein
MATTIPPSASTTYGGGGVSTVSQGIGAPQSALWDRLLNEKLKAYEEDRAYLRKQRGTTSPLVPGQASLGASTAAPARAQPAAPSPHERRNPEADYWDEIARQGPVPEYNAWGMVVNNPDSIRRYNLSLSRGGIPQSPTPAAGPTWGSTYQAGGTGSDLGFSPAVAAAYEALQERQRVAASQAKG